MSAVKKRVCIGIPCYQGVSAETLEDYMLFAFYLGRHYTQYEFFVAIKSKSEQFRARNAIVDVSLQMGCDYLLMLDDDHVIDWERKASITPDTEKPHYTFLAKLLDHLTTQENAGIVGALYYQRGGDCRPVLMKEGKEGGYYWMRDDEITDGLQEVDVTGGGCFLMDMNIFSKIPSPWFEPELQLGTDIQICEKARKAGYKVFCDTSIILGHVLNQREIVTPKNRLRIQSESMAKTSNVKEGLESSWQENTALTMYRIDAEEYLGISFDRMPDLAADYQKKYNKFDLYGNHDDYYRSLGHEQLARQVCFHHTPAIIEESKAIWNMVNHQHSHRGLDFGCGSSPVGFELALRGHYMDFIDLDGTSAYKFTKWRAGKRNINCGFTWNGTYDFIMFMDSIEHIADWEPILQRAVDSVKNNGFIITNFFLNQDYENKEHVNMDKKGVKELLISNGLYPLNELVWMKKDMAFMDKQERTA